MTIHEFSYLIRYLFVFLAVIFVALQLKRTLAELRLDLRYRVQPVAGSCLLPRQSGGPAVFPLYHTNSIGWSRHSDIRLEGKQKGKRAAFIYLYDGEWFIRPAGRNHLVAINGVRVLPPTPIRDQDLLLIGGYEYLFSHDRQSGSRQQLPKTWPAPLCTHRSTGSWLAANGFALLGILLTGVLIPSDLPDLQMILTVFYLGLLLIMNVYSFILPVFLQNIDRSLMLILLLLSALGLTFQIRLSFVILDQNPALTVGAVTAAILKDLSSQGFSLVLGLALLPVITALVARTRLLEPLSIVCAILTPLLLLATLVLGNGADAYGATLWINIGGFSIQLTEFAKITYLIVLASFFKNRPARRVQVFFAGWALFVFALIMLLPDLGSAMILLPVTLLVYVVMTSEYGTTFFIMISGTAVGGLAYALFPHVRRRLEGWTTLWTEVNDSNRQIVYGLQAIARGGLFGRGLDNGSPGGIPLASSDMVFAMICEELGLLTGLAVVLIFIILWLRSARITLSAQDGFTSALALAIGSSLFVEAMIVIAGVAGLIPLTGVTLPLIARGGSSILAKLILIAILLGLSARKTREVGDGEP